MIEKNAYKKLHHCNFSLARYWGLYQGPVVDRCEEDDSGDLWICKNELERDRIPVNYCPFCGYKAIKQMESK